MGLGFFGGEFSVVGDEALFEHLVEDRVASFGDVEGEGGVDGGAGPSSVVRFVGESGEDIELSDGVVVGSEFVEDGAGLFAELVEEEALAFDGAAAGAQDFVFELFELGGDVSLGVFEGLLACENVGGAGCLSSGELDVVPKHFVVSDFHGWEIVLFHEFGLVVDEPGPGVAFESSCFVELGIDSVAEESAFSQVGRWVFDALGHDGVGDRGEGAFDGDERGAVGFEGGALFEGVDECADC